MENSLVILPHVWKTVRNKLICLYLYVWAYHEEWKEVAWFISTQSENILRESLDACLIKQHCKAIQMAFPGIMQYAVYLNI